MKIQLISLYNWPISKRPDSADRKVYLYALCLEDGHSEHNFFLTKEDFGMLQNALEGYKEVGT